MVTGTNILEHDMSLFGFSDPYLGLNKLMILEFDILLKDSPQ